MWGLGGLTFGLTMRYLGMSLGMAVALGYCAAFGTLVPPIYHGEFREKILDTTSGNVILFGIVVCLLGIAIAGMAGMSKEREMGEAQKKALIKEFNFKKGILVATFSGVFSAASLSPWMPPTRSPTSPKRSIRRRFGAACRNSASCWRADLPRISFGACI